MKPPSPPDTVGQYTTECKTNRKTNRLPTAHGRECIVPTPAMECGGNDADGRRQAESNGDATETAENDQLVGIACQTTSEGEERLEDRSNLVHKPRAKSVGDRSREQENTAASQSLDGRRPMCFVSTNVVIRHRGNGNTIVEDCREYPDRPPWSAR